MKERMRFVTDWERDLYSMAELCERYGVSRKTGISGSSATSTEGPEGCASGARAAHCPHRISPDIAAGDLRRAHGSTPVGSREVLHWLKRRHPAMDCPPRARRGTSSPGAAWSRSVARRHYTHPGSCPRRRAAQ